MGPSRFAQSQLLIVSLLLFSACTLLAPKKELGFRVEFYGAEEVISEQGEVSSIFSLNLPVYRATYENGLTVLISPNHTLPIFSYYTFFDVGGRHESEAEGTTGASHFLEHMLFKGSKRYGPGEFDSAIENSGGRTNAYTTFDSTVYYQHLPTHMLNLIIDMEADRMTDVLLDPIAFESERQVIFNERKMRYENSPQGMLYLALMQNFFRDSPYGGSVIGSVEDLTNLTREQTKEFFINFYTPDNAVIVIVGDVDPERTFREIARRYSHLQPSSQEIQEFKDARNDPEIYKRRTPYNTHVRLTAPTPSPLFAYAFPGEKMQSDRGHIIDFLSLILAQGESSFLHQHYVSSARPRLTSVRGGHFQLMYDGVLFVMGDLAPGQDLEWMRRDMLRQLRRSCSDAINERQLQKAKNQLLTSLYSQLTTNAGLAEFLGRQEFYYGDFRTYQALVERYHQVTVEDLKRECVSLFHNDNNLFISIQQ